MPDANSGVATCDVSYVVGVILVYAGSPHLWVGGALLTAETSTSSVYCVSSPVK